MTKMELNRIQESLDKIKSRKEINFANNLHPSPPEIDFVKMLEEAKKYPHLFIDIAISEWKERSHAYVDDVVKKMPFYCEAVKEKELAKKKREILIKKYSEILTDKVREIMDKLYLSAKPESGLKAIENFKKYEQKIK